LAPAHRSERGRVSLAYAGAAATRHRNAPRGRELDGAGDGTGDGFGGGCAEHVDEFQRAEAEGDAEVAVHRRYARVDGAHESVLGQKASEAWTLLSRALVATTAGRVLGPRGGGPEIAEAAQSACEFH